MATKLLEHTLLSAHDPKTGRYDARRLAAALEITSKEMAAIVGYTPTGLSKNPTSPRLQPQLRSLVMLINRLRDLLDGRMEFVRIWLKAPHPYLEGRGPLSYLQEGKFEAVDTLVHLMETGQPG
jgi:hypothetical protein